MKKKNRSILLNLHNDEDGFEPLQAAFYLCVGTMVIGGICKIGSVVIPPTFDGIVYLCDLADERWNGKIGSYTPQNYKQNPPANTNPGPANNGEIEIEIQPHSNNVIIQEVPE